MNATKKGFMNAIASALIAPPAQETRIIPANVIEVRVKRTAIVPFQPAAIRPKEITFQPVPGLAIPRFLPYAIRLLSHDNYNWSGSGISYRLDPASVMIEDICERVYLTRFQYQTMTRRPDPVLPIFLANLFDFHEYARPMRALARILPDYATGKTKRFYMVEAVNELLTFIGLASEHKKITDRELTFASWHLVGALQKPENYV